KAVRLIRMLRMQGMVNAAQERAALDEVGAPGERVLPDRTPPSASSDTPSAPSGHAEDESPAGEPVMTPSAAGGGEPAPPRSPPTSEPAPGPTSPPAEEPAPAPPPAPEPAP